MQSGCSFLFFEEGFNEKSSIAAVGFLKFPTKLACFVAQQMLLDMLEFLGQYYL